MICPKCHKDTAVLVTTQANIEVQEHRPIVIWLLCSPYFFVRWLYRVCFVGKKETYQKKQHYHCNYCGNDWDPTVDPAKE